MDSLTVAHSGALSLARLVKDSGRFRYQYDSVSGEDLGGYNALRHAGTVWSMLDVYSEVKDPLLLVVSRRAITYMLNKFFKYFRDYRYPCICESDEIKLGGNGLSILALVSMHEVSGDLRPLELAKQLADFILNHRTPDDDLVHKRFFRSGEISSFRSQYYTGEALFALTVLYRVTGEQRWLESVQEIELRLAPQDYGVSGQSHWMLYFLEQLANFDNRPEIYAHARKIAEHMLDHPKYLDWNRSTPIACRSEGLLAFMRMRRPESVDDEQLKSRCMERIQHNLLLQREFLGADGSFLRGGTSEKRTQVRIDYIQHNISSFLHYHRLMEA